MLNSNRHEGENRASGEWLFQLTGFVMLFLAIFSGRFSLDRIVGIGWDSPLLDLRVLALFGGYAVYFVGRAKGLWIEQGQVSDANWFLILLGIFLSYAGWNIISYGNEGIKVEFFYDMASMMATLFLIYKFGVCGQLLAGLAFVAEVFGGMLFVLAAAGVGNPDLNGHSWAPIGGPITFYRIEGFAFFGALYLAWITDRQKVKLFHYLIAAMCLFATLASLSKGALLALMISACVVVLYWLVFANYRALSRFLLVVAVTGIAFSLSKGWVMSARIQVGVDISVPVNMSVQNDAASGVSDMDAAYSGNNRSMLLGPLLEKYSARLKINDFTEDELQRLDAIWTIFKDYNPPDYKSNPAAFFRWVDSFAVMRDGSARLRMAQVAVSQFLENKLFGAGIGKYRFMSLGSGYRDAEVYFYPHNIILEIAAAMGVLGLVLFCGSIFAGLVVVARRLVVDEAVIFWIGYLIFFFVTALFSGDLYDFRIYWYVVLLVAFMRTIPCKTARGGGLHNLIR